MYFEEGLAYAPLNEAWKTPAFLEPLEKSRQVREMPVTPLTQKDALQDAVELSLQSVTAQEVKAYLRKIYLEEGASGVVPLLPDRGMLVASPTPKYRIQKKRRSKVLSFLKKMLRGFHEEDYLMLLLILVFVYLALFTT